MRPNTTQTLPHAREPIPQRGRRPPTRLPFLAFPADRQELAGHPAVAMYAVGNEIPPDMVRWYGADAASAFLQRLCLAVKATDPGALVTYGGAAAQRGGAVRAAGRNGPLKALRCFPGPASPCPPLRARPSKAAQLARAPPPMWAGAPTHPPGAPKSSVAHALAGRVPLPWRTRKLLPVPPPAANYPSTEYLGVGAPCIDVASFNVYLEDVGSFKKYLDRLQVWGRDPAGWACREMSSHACPSRQRSCRRCQASAILAVYGDQACYLQAQAWPAYSSQGPGSWRPAL